MAFIITKTPADQAVSQVEAGEFVADMLDGVTLTHAATITSGAWHVFVFSIGDDELSECDDTLGDLLDEDEIDYAQYGLWPDAFARLV